MRSHHSIRSVTGRELHLLKTSQLIRCIYIYIDIAFSTTMNHCKRTSITVDNRSEVSRTTVTGYRRNTPFGEFHYPNELRRRVDINSIRVKDLTSSAILQDTASRTDVRRRLPCDFTVYLSFSVYGSRGRTAYGLVYYCVARYAAAAIAHDRRNDII